MHIEHSERVRDLLNQFPRPIVLKPSVMSECSRMSIAALLFICSIFYITRHFTMTGVLLGLCGMGISALMAGLVQTLTLDGSGFTIRYLIGSRRYRWDETRDFHGRDIERGTFLLFDYSRVAERWWAKKLNRIFFSGKNACIFGDFGLHAVDLAALMNGWRVRALPPGG